jgi:hypothetical protein
MVTNATTKPRRKIVPELIVSPVRTIANDATAPSPSANLEPLGDLKAQSELAAELLGPGRKIYVKLAPTEERPVPVVSWAQVRPPARQPLFSAFSIIAKHLAVFKNLLTSFSWISH